MSRVADPSTTNEIARFEAQKLAFAPLIFQACRALRDTGMLTSLRHAGAKGLSAREAAEATNTTLYAAALLLEGGLAGGLCHCDATLDDPRFVITKAGVYWMHDALTRVHSEFVHHVCYEGAFRLPEALRDGVPAGLSALAPPADDASKPQWATVYEALAHLSPEVRKAWFDFDHYHSDGVFELCLDRILTAVGEGDLLDIGGNTGKFARLILELSPEKYAKLPKYTMVDLPGQIATAKEQLGELSARATFAPRNLLDETAPLPAADVVWMSQFLDCFSEAQIVSILRRVHGALRPGGTAFILETYWDKQRHDAARLCVIGTSLYFACIANGDSRMYHSAVMRRLVHEAGLRVVAEDHEVGMSHSLFTLARAEDAPNF